MLLPTLRQWPSAMFTHGLGGVMSLLLTGILLMPEPPSAWGQLVPAADSRLPGQPLSPAGKPLAGTTSNRSRPLIAFRRDQQNPGAMQPDVRQPATPPLPKGHDPAQQREAPTTDPIMVPAAPMASPAQVSAEFSESAKQAGTGTTREVFVDTRPNAENSRRLLPSTGNPSGLTAGTRLGQRSAANNRRASGLANSFPPMDVVRTAGTGLGIALGLLLLCVWLFRRNAPSPTTPLPKEVVSVLGRAQLATRQFVQLLRIGNKLVLVSVTPEGTEPITEVTDPVEVDRLLSLCMRNHTQSTTAEFQQVLNQLSHEGGKGFLGK